MLQHGEQLLIAYHQGVFALEKDSENAKGVLQVGAPVFVLKASDSIPNRVYLGTQNGLTAMEYDGENWQPLEFTDALPFPIRSMVNAPDGYTWLGTDFSGVIRLQLDDSLFPSTPDWTRFAEPEGFTSTFQLEPTLIDGKLYIARSDSLYELAESGDRVKITRDFGSFFPQVETSIWNAHKDNSGRLWIHRFENNPRRSELGFAVEIDGDYQWQSPSYLRALDNHHLPTFYADDSGILWYGGAPGLFRINPEATPPEEYQYSLRLRDIRDSEDQSLLALLAEEGALTVPYADNRLRFEFAAPSHVQREAIRYQVRLDGLDSNWSPWFEEPSMTYTGLREGSYQFQVRARDAQGNISATTAIDFRILAPWYRSVRAYLVFALVALFAGRALLRWRFSRLETQKRELEHQVHERTRQLEEAMVTVQLTGLHNRRYLERFLEQDLAGVHRLFDD
ncbi:MAG: hypothetical protein LAT77_08270 [Aliidiomarina sp.]|uniref:triple tyrosine motif-containing protein n=1 Tax=Aliidiomarina sp. TaxID=1872439 RepID=UPI0025B8E689|nr:triple tyrosine motif-containing protein [Aliidiomarina sp.]MCH8501887.1 hypothetical protein [Aliidiomarina sp.]